MLDKTIPFYRIIMRCDRVLPMEIKLPQGYSIRTYQPGDEDAWAALECAIGDFATREEALALFSQRYLADPALTDRIFFAIAPIVKSPMQIACYIICKGGPIKHTGIA